MLRLRFEPFGPPDPEFGSPRKKRTRILMLHGHGQLGGFFYYKSKPLVAALLKMAVDRDPDRCSPGIDVFYPNAPHCAGDGPEADVWRWGQGDFHSDKIKGIEQSISKVMNILEAHGPFDGIVGFSTGATMAAIITSLLEDIQRMPACVEKLTVKHPRFQFAVCVSGFKLEHPDYECFYRPQIETPIMHLMATHDTMIPQQLTDRLIKACANSAVHVFEGTHYVPRDRRQTMAAGHFILQQLGWGYGADVTNGGSRSAQC